MNYLDNRDMPAMPLQGDSARKAFGSLENHMPNGLTKYEHVVLEFAKSLVANGGRDPDSVVTAAECLALQYFKRLDK